MSKYTPLQLSYKSCFGCLRDQSHLASRLRCVEDIMKQVHPAYEQTTTSHVISILKHDSLTIISDLLRQRGNRPNDQDLSR